jgi:PITH domain
VSKKTCHHPKPLKLYPLRSTGRGSETPRRLRIYANHPNIIDFSEAESESVKPHLDISLLEGETGVVEYPLRVAAFTSVHALSMFFVSPSLLFLALQLFADCLFLLSDNIPLQSDAVGGEQSRIYYLGFRGDTRYTKKEVNSKLEVPAPNAAEAALTEKVTHKAGSQQTTAR